MLRHGNIGVRWLKTSVLSYLAKLLKSYLSEMTSWGNTIEGPVTAGELNVGSCPAERNVQWGPCPFRRKDPR